MAISMTGYGRGETVQAGRRVTVEVKSINNRYCDIQFRMPRILAALENRLREEITGRLSRGKIDVSITYEDSSPDAYRVSCDIGLAKAYAQALREIAEAAQVPADLNAGSLSRFNDVLRAEPAQVDPESVWILLQQALQGALDEISAMRRLEGGRLTADIRQRIDQIEALRQQIAERAPLVTEDYRERLRLRVNELLGSQASAFYDEQRLAAEVALFADKCAIDEELVRLGSHLRQADAVISLDEPTGKKLDFLVQEINREINTIGSKANDLAIVDRVVIMKTELEKIREQIQNLE
jgi:uncharacterized protein (TIGR00255 family)